jgi:epsilon-lactone hydrolase
VSPWVDLETGATIETKAAIDPLIHREYLQELAAAYLAGHDPRDPLASPLQADLAGLPPVLVQVGSAETLLDDAVRISGRLGAADVVTNLEAWPHMIQLGTSGRSSLRRVARRWPPPGPSSDDI